MQRTARPKFSTDCFVPRNDVNEGTPKKGLLEEIPYQSEANHEVVVGIVGCGHLVTHDAAHEDLHVVINRLGAIEVNVRVLG